MPLKVFFNGPLPEGLLGLAIGMNLLWPFQDSHSWVSKKRVRGSGFSGPRNRRFLNTTLGIIARPGPLGAHAARSGQ